MRLRIIDGYVVDDYEYDEPDAETAGVDAETADLDRRKLFRCNGCSRLVPWSQGCSDDMPDHCDDCWALHHGCLHVPDPFPVEVAR